MNLLFIYFFKIQFSRVWIGSGRENLSSLMVKVGVQLLPQKSLVAGTAT